MYGVSPQDWGAAVNYDQWNDPHYDKDKIICHWVGVPVPDSAARGEVSAEKAQLRSSEKWHIENRGWRGIAYGWAIGNSGTCYRLRGWNIYGAHVGDVDRDGIVENKEGIPVLFIVGPGQSVSATGWITFVNLRTYLEQHEDRQLPLYPHSAVQYPDLYPWDNSFCPGNEIRTKIAGGYMPDIRPPAEWAQPSWDKAKAAFPRLIKEDTDPWDTLEKQEFFVLLDRMGFLDTPTVGAHAHEEYSRKTHGHDVTVKLT
jgi:hypothetical protein